MVWLLLKMTIKWLSNEVCLSTLLCSALVSVVANGQLMQLPNKNIGQKIKLNQTRPSAVLWVCMPIVFGRLCNHETLSPSNFPDLQSPCPSMRVLYYIGNTIWKQKETSLATYSRLAPYVASLVMYFRHAMYMPRDSQPPKAQSNRSQYACSSPPLLTLCVVVVNFQFDTISFLYTICHVTLGQVGIW